MGVFLLILIVAGIVILIAAAVSSGMRAGQPSAPTRSRIGSAAGTRPPSRASTGAPSGGHLVIDFSFGPERLPGPAATPTECWIPEGRRVTVAGYEIPGGMLYVGRNLPGLSAWRAPIEPALIDPSLPVDRYAPDRAGSEMGYWPSYYRISARSRAAYLEWLAGGRREPGAYIGYVFLFFYGLERRVLADGRTSTAARQERPALVAEVRRLLDLYGENHSFRGYAGRFLSVARFLDGPVKLEDLEPRWEGGGWDLPLETKIALGMLARRGDPVPPSWALAWLMGSNGFNLRTPAHRCRREFLELFALRYPQRFPRGGLKVAPNKTRLTADYHPASPSFDHGSKFVELPDLPDVTQLTAPVRKLQGLADDLSQELDAYSRWVGRTEDRESPRALALLPQELAARRESPEASALCAWLEESLEGAEVAVVSTGRLAELWWEGAEPKRLAQKESEMLARFLGARGYGIEPDVRYGTPAFASVESAVVFRWTEEGPPPEPSPAYWSACLLMHLPILVSVADGELGSAEHRHLLEHVEQSLHLTPAERRRLEAHVRRLMADPPGFAGLKRKLEFVEEALRHDMARFLLSVAGADGHIHPEEIRVLRKIYPFLGLEPDSVYADLHALVAGGPTDASGAAATPVGSPAAIGKGRQPEAGPIDLDPERILRTRRDTERVVEVLSEVFGEPEEEAADAPPPPVTPPPADDALVGNLDPLHSALLLHLGSRPSWDRGEVERLATRLGLLTAGALEVINSAACELCGDPLLEDGEVIEVDQEIFQEMTA